MNRKHFILKSIVIFIGLLLFLIIYYIANQETATVLYEQPNGNGLEIPKEAEEEIIKETERDQSIMVDIKGAVQNPGVYEVQANMRVHDVVQLAGGLTENADVFSINFAERVYDEMTIIVMEKGQEIASNSGGNGTSPKVKVNHATKEELMTLPNIGPSKADAIIQYREENGMFQKPEDLMEVSGIGEKTFEQLKDFIQIP